MSLPPVCAGSWTGRSGSVASRAPDGEHRAPAALEQQHEPIVARPGHARELEPTWAGMPGRCVYAAGRRVEDPDVERLGGPGVGRVGEADRDEAPCGCTTTSCQAAQDARPAQAPAGAGGEVDEANPVVRIDGLSRRSRSSTRSPCTGTMRVASCPHPAGAGVHEQSRQSASTSSTPASPAPSSGRHGAGTDGRRPGTSPAGTGPGGAAQHPGRGGTGGRREAATGREPLHRAVQVDARGDLVRGAAAVTGDEGAVRARAHPAVERAGRRRDRPDGVRVDVVDVGRRGADDQMEVSGARERGPLPAGAMARPGARSRPAPARGWHRGATRPRTAYASSPAESTPRARDCVPAVR